MKLLKIEMRKKKHLQFADLRLNNFNMTGVLADRVKFLTSPDSVQRTT